MCAVFGVVSSYLVRCLATDDPELWDIPLDAVEVENFSNGCVQSAPTLATPLGLHQMTTRSKTPQRPANQRQPMRQNSWNQSHGNLTAQQRAGNVNLYC